MRKILFIFLVAVVFCVGCRKDIIAPVDPWEYGGQVEIMYERVRQVVNPNGMDPTGGANIDSPEYGGMNSSQWTSIGDNKWLASANLYCSLKEYSISTADGKLGLHPVGVRFFLRPKREGAQWVELTCITVDPYDPEGQAAKFIFYKGQIQKPTGCP